MTKPINISKFLGMNNIKAKEGKLNEPRIILNADVTEEGRIVKRDGYTEFVAMTSPHSLWAGTNCMLCVASNTLYRIDNGAAVSIGAITTHNESLYYEEINGKVYVSSKYGTGVFSATDNSLSDWGQADPPEVDYTTSTSGGLEAGKYQICYTTFDSDNQLSGNGPITEVSLAESGSITVTNRPDSGVVWITDTNGGHFMLAGEVDTITSPPSAEPLPTLWCKKPPKMKNIVFAHGRMWGSVGNILYYSEPNRVDLWNTSSSFFQFEREITMIARVSTGLFVGGDEETYFLQGEEPDKMSMGSAGAGVIEGTLVYSNQLKELGDMISPQEKVHENVPCWVSKEGTVAGNASGRLFNFTQGRIKFAPGDRGASLFRIKDGQFQLLTSVKQGSDGESMGMSDSATVDVVRNGQVI